MVVFITPLGIQNVLVIINTHKLGTIINVPDFINSEEDNCV